MISSETCRPSAFDADGVDLAVHLLQQEIELPAAGLGASVSASQCARCPRNRVTSSEMSDRWATRTTSCASAAWSIGMARGQLARPLEQPRLQLHAAGFGGQHHGVDEHAQQSRRRASRRAGAPPSWVRMRLQLRQRAVTAPSTAAASASGVAPAFGQPLADAQRLRQPEQVAGPERAVDHALLARRLERG